MSPPRKQKTKIHLQNKFSENRTIYVSWLAEDGTSQPWVDEFWVKISQIDPPNPPRLRRVDETLPGDLVNVSVDQILDGVTDLVAVVTGKYLEANRKGSRPTDRAFARFLELKKADQDGGDRKRAWVAFLQRFPRQHTILSETPMSNIPQFENEPFALPPSDNEIYEAVIEILGLD